MEIFINEESLHGQYKDIREFTEALSLLVFFLILMSKKGN